MNLRAVLTKNCLPFLSNVITLCTLFSVSTQSFAMGELLKKQSVEHINTGLLILFTCITALMVLLAAQHFRSAKRKTKYEKALKSHQHSLDTLPTGIVHVNLDGKVIYANIKGATLLGRQLEKLIDSEFSANFDAGAVSLIDNSLREQQCSLQARAKSSNLHLAIQLGKPITESEQPYRVLTLHNQNKIQRQLDQALQQRDEQLHLIKASNLAQVRIHVLEDKCVHDHLFDQLLSINAVNQVDEVSEACSISSFVKHVHNADKGDWTKAFNKAISSGKSTVSLRMQLSLSQQENSYVPLDISIIGTEFNDTKQGEYSQLTLLVRENIAIEKQKTQVDLLNNQQQALLNATSLAAYALDENGCILWANTHFNSLMRRLKPEAKSKNLLEICPFPDDIMQLHKNPPTLSAQRYEMEFELNTNDNQKVWIKLNLAFYTSKDRLCAQNQIGMVGTLQDITDIKLTSIALAAEQERTANIVNLAPVAIATINGDDQILNANTVMLDRLKFSEKELNKGSFYQLFNDPAEAGMAAKHLSSKGHLRDFHANLKGKDNKLHPSELHIDLINKEKQEYLCWIADRSNEQYQQDKFESLLQHSSMPMAILAENGFTKLNQPACDFFCVADEYDLFGVSPNSLRLNQDPESAAELASCIEEVKSSGKAKSMHWLHQVGDQQLPCQASYVPMYKDQCFDSILCIWTDKRELEKVDKARMEAINLRQAAEREIEEKLKLLSNSQSQLANKSRTLADTEQKLQTVQEDLNETQSEFTHLQQEHQNINKNLQVLNEQYAASRAQLADAQAVNENLNTQLQTSSIEVQGLAQQRQQIADALKQSEENYKSAQQALTESKENAADLTVQKETHEQQLQALHNQINAMKDAVSTKDSQISQVSEQINTLQLQLVSSGNATEKLRQQLINQRKASEEAEKQRRDIDHSYQIAQAELSNKERHLQHLQSEMQKLEEMSSQEKGDMQAQQSALKLELEAKLSQLQETQNALNAAQVAAEHEKQEKADQQARLAHVEKELLEKEAAAIAKHKEMEAKEQVRREQQIATQNKLSEELKAKQLKLQQTEQILSQAKQQTASEKAEKEQHQQVLEQLKTELQDIETRNAAQQAQISQSDEQWNRNKEELKQEVEAKRIQLQETKQALNEIQHQADKERISRIEQEHKLEQLTLELNDVETRANKQKEMLTGSDEQWRKHHAEIEQQKKQLQQALQQAESQNQSLQNKLEGKLEALQDAETQVSQTQSGEKDLQNELERVRSQAQGLQQKIADQGQKEEQLHNQLLAQQQALESKASSILELQQKQEVLTNELTAVQEEYSNSKASLSKQHNSHASLSAEMLTLEQSLAQSKQALEDKEIALQAAQEELQTSKNKLAQKEDALLSAHKKDLAEASQDNTKVNSGRPDIEKLTLPDNPTVWFDLLEYLQTQPQMVSLPIALKELMDELESTIKHTENALEIHDVRAILSCSKTLVNLANKINSDALSYLMKSIENDCNNGMVDNVSIRWPATKQGLQKTLRVVYSHLQA